jgi:hypothetical protein
MVYDISLTSKIFECRLKYVILEKTTEKIQIIGENEIILQNFDRWLFLNHKIITS